MTNAQVGMRIIDMLTLCLAICILIWFGIWWGLGYLGLCVFVKLVIDSYILNHCPDCGCELGEIKENQNGWLYKECFNPQCSSTHIGYEMMLKNLQEIF
jgi:hypothetical protein